MIDNDGCIGWECFFAKVFAVVVIAGFLNLIGWVLSYV